MRRTGRHPGGGGADWRCSGAAPGMRRIVARLGMSARCIATSARRRRAFVAAVRDDPPDARMHRTKQYGPLRAGRIALR
ncbi:hypothetical protein BLAT2472_11197 [Burkholderia latens]